MSKAERDSGGSNKSEPGTPSPGSPTPPGVARKRTIGDKLASLTPSRLLKSAVSKKKNRFKEDEFDLDLSYMDDGKRLIAMGFPAQNIEGIYRNSMTDVKKFFAKYHAGHYKVYNLCSERKYADKEFEAQAHFPFEDHNPCPLSLIPPFLLDCKEFLDKDPLNVVAIHCKAGKGRTGLMVCCLYLYLGLVKTAQDALDMFAARRTKNNKGVTIPSQMRYVNYCERWLYDYHKVDKPFPFKGKPVKVKSFTMSFPPHFDAGGGCDPYLKAYNSEGMLLHNSSKHQKTLHWYAKDNKFKLRTGFYVDGDVHLVFYDKDEGLGGDDKMFGFWFHTAMLPDKGYIKANKYQLDKACNDTHEQYFDDDFCCKMYYDTITVEEFEALPLNQKQEGGWNDKGEKGLMGKIKGQVSKKKLRFQKDGFDLDLSYITERIIAMGFPSQGTEGIFRNNIKDVKRFFTTYHQGHFKIYNLCSERQYAPAEFEAEAGGKGQVAWWPFNDHNPPPFYLIAELCVDCSKFLSEDAKNVVAIHCKAGKGRTGTIVACLLLWLGVCSNALQALQHFGAHRTANGKGVTVPSQIRYVKYFGDFMNMLPKSKRNDVPEDKLKELEDKPVHVTKISIGPNPPNFDVGGGCDPYFKVMRIQDGAWIYDSTMFNKIKPYRKKGEWRELSCDFVFKGDVRVVFFDKDVLGGDDEMFSFWLYAGLMPQESPLRLGKAELDGACKESVEKFDDTFQCDVEFKHTTAQIFHVKAAPMSKKRLSITVGGHGHVSLPGSPMSRLSDSGGSPVPASPTPLGRMNSTKGLAAIGSSRSLFNLTPESAGGRSSSAGSRSSMIGISANFIRRKVSKKKLRFVEDGFDLDLSYVTDNIIAMGFPSSGAEGMLRNSMTEVKRFLQEYHANMFKVYNLCSERKYDPHIFDDIGGEFAHYPFDDHNPPPFDLLPKICHDARNFLNRSPQHTVLIHCKAGKGRTGCVIAALLLFMNEFNTATEALEYYGRMRTKNAKGVTIPSQRRYINYFEHWLRWMHTPNTPIAPVPVPTARILSFELGPTPPNFDVGGGCDPYFIMTNSKGETLYNMKKDKKQKVLEWRQKNTTHWLNALEVDFTGDVKITFYDKDVVSLSKDDKMFSFWLHSAFIDETPLKLEKADLDKACKDKKHFDKAGFYCNIELAQVTATTSGKRSFRPTVITSAVAEDEEEDDDEIGGPLTEPEDEHDSSEEEGSVPPSPSPLSPKAGSVPPSPSILSPKAGDKNNGRESPPPMPPSPSESMRGHGRENSSLESSTRSRGHSDAAQTALMLAMSKRHKVARQNASLKVETKGLQGLSIREHASKKHARRKSAWEIAPEADEEKSDDDEGKRSTRDDYVPPPPPEYNTGVESSDGEDSEEEGPPPTPPAANDDDDDDGAPPPPPPS